jgi:hypothetical protein
MMVRKVDVTVQFYASYKDGSQSLAAERVRPTMPRPKQRQLMRPFIEGLRSERHYTKTRCRCW